MAGVYWIGQDGQVYVKQANVTGVKSYGTPEEMAARQQQSGINFNVLDGLTEIADPAAPVQQQAASTGSYAADTGISAAEQRQIDEKAAQDAMDAQTRATLRGEIGGKGAEIDTLYASLFGDLNTLVGTRAAELEKQYGVQLTNAAEQYTTAIPQIETSYAAIGSGDSTDNADAKTGAKKGFDKTTETIGENKKADKAKLGQYKTEQETKFTVDRDAAKTNIARAATTEDLAALTGLRNDVETNIGSAKVTKASLGTDASGRDAITKLTSDNGRYDAAVGALDSILKSSMSGAVKEAAIQAVTTSAGLSDDEKKKVQETYGNVYAEQAAL